MTDATEIYAIAVWGGVVFLYLASLMDERGLFLKMALIGTLLMGAHHYAEGDEMYRPHRIPNRCTHTGPKVESWTQNTCPIALNQTELRADCLSVAIIHAFACDKGVQEACEWMAHQLDIMIKTHEYQHGATVMGGVNAAKALGYVRNSVPVGSWDEYLLALELGPVVLGFTDMTTGMKEVDGAGFINHNGKRTHIRHSMTALSHRKGWFRGRYSVIKGTWGKKWGKFGEVKLEDSDLKAMFEAGTVEAVLIVK
jgi:hypothetical protein